ncbi:MAG: ATP-dependent DNA helicase RecG [Myxococcaceae bacterium]|nr:ATP-dependent DNA helicase RecG [Myxococcaceae bacterium]
MPHPLGALVGPLTYASGRDFANLGAIKALRPVLEGAVASAAQAGLAAELQGVLKAELPHIDHADSSTRQASVKRLLGVLREAGLLLGNQVSPQPSAKVSPQAMIPPPTAQVQAPSAEPPKRARAVKGKNRATPVAGAAKTPPAADAEAPTRMLSISPRSGPLSTPLGKVGWRVNPRLIGALNKKGVRKVGDVLFLLPRVYEDRRHLRRIAQLTVGERGVFIAEVRRVEETRGRGGRNTFRAVLGDTTGSIAATHFQTGPWLKAKYPVGRRLVVSGDVRQSVYGWEIPHPEVEPADDAEGSSIHFNRVVPVYPGFERYEQRALRELVFKVAEKFADSIEEPLPESLTAKLRLLPLSHALRLIHFPLEGASLDELNLQQSPAHQRLAFDELFFLQLGVALRRRGVKVKTGTAFNVTQEGLKQAEALFPFQLTQAQQRVVGQISRDMARPEPMNRLLQGDVGSGKTAVAVTAAALAVSDGYQVAVMAPTEILAEQHYRTFQALLKPIGAETVLLTGGGKVTERRAQREGLASGHFKVAVGTHALLESGVDFQKLGLVVIDEQHRFGVMQRHALMAKGPRPDVLVMTATPIPRTLAMTLYGDLDVSVIDELPPGRTPIQTRVYVDKARPSAWEIVDAELKAGHQVYVVYPLVEESEKMDLADATKGVATWTERFPTARVGLLHGRMKNAEKEQVMSAFRSHQIDVLVCTTVIEVGVDVPNASVMVIEAAERFGLSQLHQLRGRVGRGAARSYCMLLAGYARSEEAQTRLKVMEDSHDGFVIAEKDLEIRGPGEFLGTRQSGMPELAVANLGRDQALLATAQDEARAIVAADPQLTKPEHQRLVRALEERWEGRLKLADVG